MDAGYVDEAIELLEKANAGLEPELLRAEDARRLLQAYARAEKLAGLGWSRCLENSTTPPRWPVWR